MWLMRKTATTANRRVCHKLHSILGATQLHRMVGYAISVFGRVMARLAAITLICFNFLKIAESVRKDVEVHGSTVGPGFSRISGEGKEGEEMLCFKVSSSTRSWPFLLILISVILRANETGGQLRYPDEPSPNFRTSRSGDRRILCSSQTSNAGFWSSRIPKDPIVKFFTFIWLRVINFHEFCH